MIQLDEYQRDVVPLLDGIRRAIERMRAKERGQTDLAAVTITRGVVDQHGRLRGSRRPR
ncbi:MAG: hypothetical protein O3C40_27595 [Planctomycetota bacterium]|nr:hypothetical protein [Planctomycetota bacterium]